jgi:hypothetical protein
MTSRHRSRSVDKTDYPLVVFSLGVVASLTATAIWTFLQTPFVWSVLTKREATPWLAFANHLLLITLTVLTAMFLGWALFLHGTHFGRPRIALFTVFVVAILVAGLSSWIATSPKAWSMRDQIALGLALIGVQAFAMHLARSVVGNLNTRTGRLRALSKKTNVLLDALEERLGVTQLRVEKSRRSPSQK